MKFAPNPDDFRGHQSKKDQLERFKSDIIAVHKMVDGRDNEDELIVEFKWMLQHIFDRASTYVVYKSKCGKRKIK